MMEEIDEMDGEMAVEALREIQRVCESYKGRVPQKQEAAPAEEGGLEEFAEEMGAEEPGLGAPEIEIEVSAEPSEPEPRRFVDYGKPSVRRASESAPAPQKRGPGRPRKGR
jgi:hypothetical protein